MGEPVLKFGAAKPQSRDERLRPEGEGQARGLGRAGNDAATAKLGDTRGAVYVEFLIAFMPFFLFFLCLWQVSILYFTKLLVDHAAFAAARAAAVIVAENPKRVDPNGGASSVNKLTNSRDDYVRTAAEIALAPLIVDGTILAVDVKYPTPSQPGSDDAMRGQSYPPMGSQSVSLMRVRVETIMNCKVAFANAIMCPANTLLGLGAKQLGLFVLRVPSEAVFPYQGASYTYNPKDDDGRAGSDAMASSWGGLCFAAGTPVDMADGQPRPIEQVRKGDRVVSRDEATGETRAQAVVRTFVTPDQPLVELRLRESDPIRVTPGHKFATSDRGWVAAQDLEPGESLVTEGGNELHVSGVAPLTARETVYNFEVEATHTYFVGRAGTWVHNANCSTPIPGFGGGSSSGGLPSSGAGATNGPPTAGGAGGAGGTPNGGGGGASTASGGGGGASTASGGRTGAGPTGASPSGPGPVAASGPIGGGPSAGGPGAGGPGAGGPGAGGPGAGGQGAGAGGPGGGSGGGAGATGSTGAGGAGGSKSARRASRSSLVGTAKAASPTTTSTASPSPASITSDLAGAAPSNPGSATAGASPLGGSPQGGEAQPAPAPFGALATAQTPPAPAGSSGEPTPARSPMVQLLAGVVAGGLQGWIPGGFVGNVVPMPTRYSELGRGVGEAAMGFAQMITGGAAIVGGGTAAAGGVLAAPETAGASLAVTAAGGSVAAAGVASVAQGITNVGGGLQSILHAMSMHDEPATTPPTEPTEPTEPQPQAAEQPTEPATVDPPAAEAPGINVQKQAGHVPGTPQYANRVAGGKLTSSFFDAKQAESVTLEAWQKGTPLGTDGKMRLLDFGRPVGVGPGGRGYQTQVRVSIDSAGKIHGTPWGPVFQGPLPK